MKKLIPFFVGNAIIYLIASFVAWDFSWVKKIAEVTPADRFFFIIVLFLINALALIINEIIKTYKN